MTNCLDLNESLMLKIRIQEAYDNVALYADNYFAEDEHYRRSNQVLISRIRQLNEENKQNIISRNVLDVIPGSNITKCGGYRYNDAREVCYTQSPRETNFHYSHFRENEKRNEPWMIPEVEWIYIHTMYVGSNNFKLYESQSIDWTEKIVVSGEDVPNNGTELPEASSSPVIEEITDAQQGRALLEIDQLKKQEEDILDRNLPYFFDVSEYRSAMIRESILSDDVKNLWDQKQLTSRERILQVHKSLLDNLFFQEEEYKPVVGSEFTNLQNLIISIVSLNERLPKQFEIIHTQELATTDRSTASEPLPTPQRRLYSDVVQGNKSSVKVCKSLQEPQSPKSDIADDALTAKTSGSVLLPADSLASSSSILIDAMQFDVASSTSSTMDSPIFINEKTSSHTNSQPNQPPKGLNISSSKVSSYSEAVNSNQFNLPYNDNPPILESTPIRPNNFPNYNSMPYMCNMNQNQNVRMNFRNHNHTCAHGFINPTQQQISINRTQSLNVNQTACQHPPQVQVQQQPIQQPQQHTSWYIPQYRPPNYSVVLLPQLPTKHRWTNPHYVRPPTPPQLYAHNTSQNLTWTSQSATVNRSNSNQQVNSCFMSAGYDSNGKNKKKNVVPPCSKFMRSKTPETRCRNFGTKKTPSCSVASCSSHPSRILTKHSSEDLRHESETNLTLTISECEEKSNDEDMLGCSCVDSSKEQDLERIALVEYQFSDERLYQEIERQAKEQYDGNPENLRRPPIRIWNYNALFLGGLHYAYFRLSLFVNT